MYYEIYSKGKMIKRGDKLLNTVSWSNELMTTPETTLVLPIEYLEYLSGRENIKLFINGKCFWGIVMDIEPDFDNGTVTVTLSHHITEWNNRQISINNAVADKKLNVVYDPTTSGMVRIRSLANGEEIFGAKLTLRYKDFRGVSVESINAYISKNAKVYAYRLSDMHSIPVHFVSSTVTLSQLKTYANVQTAKQGTYYAIFATASGTAITIPVIIAYAAKYSGARGEVDVDAGEASIEDSLEHILNDDNFIYYGWTMEIEKDCEDIEISYVYSMQSKYEALTQTMELTPDVWWRVPIENSKVVEIGKFGEHKPYFLSKNKESKKNIQIIGNQTVECNFYRVVNVATVISEKSDSGANALTLRDLYNLQYDKKMQKQYKNVWEQFKPLMEEFPIIIIRDSNYSEVNNERNYRSNVNAAYSVDIFAKQSPAVAPNTSREYAIIDTTSVAYEGGVIIESSYNFNDIAPVADVEYNEDGSTRKITDEERLLAELMAYKTAIKILIQSRRNYSISMTVGEMPADVNVGDKVRYVDSYNVLVFDACSKHFKKIMQADDWYYITKIDTNFTENGIETNNITISKQLITKRETNYGY